MAKAFHGYLAPGLLIGGFMVDLAMKHLPEGEFFDAICETPVCLPDAVQILTPCTFGNGWLSVVPFGKFALAFYEKSSGRGVRVHLDAAKLKSWPEINDWFLKTKKKSEQNIERLLAQIKEAGHGILSVQNVWVNPEKVRRQKLGPVAICPLCHEAYPRNDGEMCRDCRGETPYRNLGAIQDTKR